ncbi:ferrous iron transport protein B [Cellulosilyticum sp. I15G10I2]|uniref:ferrous iron transport protein B n=1 Tax=Cellulosilyticum sp. I15G10I2 TaxID=1892843 RepID=UPI00085CB47F|nr:ferrous iron transport protein B [Cellulosilyticum sp. I15G10I2]
MNRRITIALAGNPNIGKTTLFNELTGSRYTVGNWAGVTVEKKESLFTYKNTEINLVDLPGTYSLSAFSLDESIARDYIVAENPDVILNLVDASNLERNLYLTLQLLELGKPVVLALNMMDMAAEKGIHIDIIKLSSLLGIPIVPIIASKKTGINELLDQLTHPLHSRLIPTYKILYSGLIESRITHITHLLKDVSLNVSPRWIALKILEGDMGILSLLPKELQVQIADYTQNVISEHIRPFITDKKYESIADIISKTTTVTLSTAPSVTYKIDQIVTSKWLGIPIFVAVMFIIFYFTFNLVGNPLAGVLEIVFSYITESCAGLLVILGVTPGLKALIVDGILSGVFGVLTFLPNIACLFIALTILEDTGYMARVAFIMDELMKKIGLNGKSIIPMLLGFGCNVPAIMGTRTIENEEDRFTSILINPFFSCSARLPIFTLFASAFFPGKEAVVIFSLYFLGIIVATLVAFIFKKTLFKSDGIPFIMELPSYHMPSFRHIASQVWEKVQGFLIKAGTIIFVASVVLWFILNFNFNGPSEMTSSLGAMIGKAIAPIFAPLGFGNWQAALSLIAGIVGKEIVVSNMAIVYGLGGSDHLSGFQAALTNTFTPLSAYSFLVFTLLYVPCIGTLGAVKRETNSYRWVAFSAAYQVVIAWLVSFIIMNLGLLIRA